MGIHTYTQEMMTNKSTHREYLSLRILLGESAMAEDEDEVERCLITGLPRGGDELGETVGEVPMHSPRHCTA